MYSFSPSPRSHGYHAFPLWSHLLTNCSHILLILNSSINILIYCVLSSRFREEVRKCLKKMAARFSNQYR